jgi:thymidine kinase
MNKATEQVLIKELQQTYSEAYGTTLTVDEAGEFSRNLIKLIKSVAHKEDLNG